MSKTKPFQNAMNGTKSMPPTGMPARLTANGQRPRTPNTDKDFSCCKIVLLGSSGVGKTGKKIGLSFS